MLHDNGRCESVLQILQLLSRCYVGHVSAVGWASNVSSIPERRSKKDTTLSSNGTSVGELTETSSAADVYWSSFRCTKNPIVGSQDFVQMSRLLAYSLSS